MKNALLSLLLAATVVLVGCDGFNKFFVSQGGGSGGGGGGSTTSGYFYVLNGGTNQVVGYQITTGKLAAINGGSVNLEGLTCLAISPNNQYLYVGTTAGIYYFTISSTTGALTAAGSGAISSIVPQSMTVDSTNSWLVVAPQTTAALAAIPLSTTTGGYSGGTVQTAVLSAATPVQVKISPDNTHVFVTLGVGGTNELPFTATATNPLGTEVTTNVLNTGGAAFALGIDPANKYVYIGETLALSPTAANGAGLRVFTIAAGANTISEVSGSPFAAGGSSPSSILPDYTGDYVYVANQVVSGQTTGNITGYGITSNASGSNVSLTALTNSPYTAGTATAALAEDNSHSFIIAVNLGGSPDMGIYIFDTTNPGAINQSISTSTGTDPTGAFAVAAAH